MCAVKEKGDTMRMLLIFLAMIVVPVIVVTGIIAAII